MVSPAKDRAALWYQGHEVASQLAPDIAHSKQQFRSCLAIVTNSCACIL